MFDKLDKIKEQAVVTAIEKIIDTSRHMPGTDLNKLAADVFRESDMTPQLVRRACEAYNKSKSVYTLQKRAADDRAEDFDLIDPEAVHSELYGYIPKAAAAFNLTGRDFRDNIPDLREKLQKVALDASEAPEPLADIGVIEREIYRTSQRLDSSVAKLRSKVGMHKQASEDAIHRICQVMRDLQDKHIQKVARITVNRYGDDGVRLMRLVGAYIEKDLPLTKTANAALLPLREPYLSISIAIDEARAHGSSDTMLTKTADKLGDAYGVASSVGGTAKRTAKKLLDPAIEFAKLPMYAQMNKDHKDKGDEAFDATLRNKLQQLRATQAFVDIASDDFVKDYPVDDTVAAYNNVVGSMPELLDEKYSSWLKSLVREQLVQGNVMDANNIQQLQTIQKEVKKGRTADIDEAVKDMDSRKGEALAGLDVNALPGSPAPAPKKESKAPKPEPKKDEPEDEKKPYFTEKGKGKKKP